MRRLLVSCVLGSTLLACGGPIATYQGPPPEYEAPRGAVAPAQPVAPEVPAPPAVPFGSQAALEREVDSYLSSFGKAWGAAYKPMGIVLIAQRGEPLVVRAFADPSGAAPNLDTSFRVGSLSKQFTAACVLRLAEANKLSVKDPVRRWIPELPASFDGLTLHQLLNQTSGIPSYTEDPKLLGRKMDAVAMTDVLQWIAASKRDSSAPPRHVYSNSNYYLLGVVIERASGAPYAEALQTWVARPAGLTRTGVAPVGDNAAVGWRRDTNEALVKADVVGDTLPFAAGAVRSTARDLLTWEGVLSRDGFLTPASRAMLFEGGASVPGIPGGVYNYGWISEPMGETKTHWHNGAIDGFGSFMLGSPDLTVIALSNQFDFDTTKVGRALAALAILEKLPALAVEEPLLTIDEPFASPLVGTYVIDKKARADLATKLPAVVLESIDGLTLGFKDGVVTAKPVGQGAFALKRKTDGALFHPGLGVTLIPTMTAVGKKQKVRELTLKQGGLSVPYVPGKLPPPKKPSKPAPAAP